MKIIDATTPAEQCARVLRCRFPGLAEKVRVLSIQTGARYAAEIRFHPAQIYVACDSKQFYAGLTHHDTHAYRFGSTPLRALVALLRAMNAPSTDPGLSGQVNARLQEGMTLILAADREGRELGGRTWDQVPG